MALQNSDPVLYYKQKEIQNGDFNRIRNLLIHGNGGNVSFNSIFSLDIPYSRGLPNKIRRMDMTIRERITELTANVKTMVELDEVVSKG